MAIDIQELAMKAGTDKSGLMPRVDADILSLEGEEGYFRLKSKSGEKNLGPTVSGVFLKVRVQYGAYLEEGNNNLFTDEQDSAQHTFKLFQKLKTKTEFKTTLIDTGKGKELQERHPDIKFRQMIYFLTGGRVVKLQVKGTSLSNLFRTKEQAEEEKHPVGYFNQFEDEHSFQYLTTLEAEKFTKKIGAKVKTFYKIKFIKGDKLPDEEMQIVSEKINSIYDTIKAGEAWIKERDIQAQGKQIETGKVENYATQDDDIPVIDEEEEIDPANIPF